MFLTSVLVGVGSFTPLLLYPQYPLYRRLRGPQNPFEGRGEENKLVTAGVRTFNPLPSIPVLAILRILTKSFAGRIEGDYESVPIAGRGSIPRPVEYKQGTRL
jgi:hypothetical protein